jgi:hypothetical protein
VTSRCDRSRSARRSRWGVAALTLAAGCIGALSLPGGAAASTVQCGGNIRPFEPEAGQESGAFQMEYRIRCNEAVRAYTIVSSKTVDYFSTEVLVIDSAGQPTPEFFQCEGPFPGSGFGCKGSANFGNRIVGEFSTMTNPCGTTGRKADRLKTWVTVTTVQKDASNRDFIISSHPISLKGSGCNGERAEEARQQRESRR